MDDKKKKALAGALTQIEGQFGKGAVMRMSDAAIQDVMVIPTGSLTLDVALGIGGLPRGRIVEIYGPESSGKTTLTLHVVAEAQKQGGCAAFIDAEHALDPQYAAKLGVNVGDLLISQPDTGEQALEIANMLACSGAVDVIIVDSVAALTPRAEIEGDMGDSHMGLHARLMSQALRKLTANVKRSNTLLVFINQLRMKIGIVYGSPEVTTGGNALKFYASVRLDIRKMIPIKEGDAVVGNETKVKVVKNKMAPPFREANFNMIYGRGIDQLSEIAVVGPLTGVLQKSGSWYSYNGTRLCNGKEALRNYLNEHPDVGREISEKVKAFYYKNANALPTFSEEEEGMSSPPVEEDMSRIFDDAPTHDGKATD